MANPTLLDMPIARDGNKNAIPTTDNGTTGLLSQQYGWQLINAIPPQQGGKAVKREDFNGALYLLSNLLFYLQKGWQFEWDANQNYYAGCIVKDPNNGKMYQRLNDGTSTTAPHSDTTNWKLWDLSMLANYLPLSGGTLTGTLRTKDVAIPSGSYLRSTVDSERLELLGGTGPSSGANLTLFGAHRTDGFEGVAELRAFTSNQNTNLLCYPDGRMIWNRNDLAGSAIVSAVMSNEGYIKNAKGLIMQWGSFDINNTLETSITFPISFSARPRILLSIDQDGETPVTATVVLKYLTTSTTGTTILGTNSSHGFWFAVGV